MPQSQFEAESAWLASVDLSTTGTWTYEFQTLPRPKGESTKVIYTEYDLPRKETQPHDVIVDQDGMVWYSDFSNQFAGVLDPKTGKATDIPIPVLKPEQPKGSLAIELEPGQKHVWLAMMYQAGIAQIDRATHEVKAYGFPKEWQSTSAQASMVSPQHADVDGKVWTNNQDTHYMYRLDVKTGQFENSGRFQGPARQADLRLWHADRSPEQRLSAGVRRDEYRGARRQDRHGDDFRDADQEFAAAARPGR